MGLEDFDKIDVEDINEKNNEKVKKSIEDEIELKDILYYISHLDDLLVLVKENYYEYVNAKIKYEFKKNYYQTNINWNEENALRENNGLPKVTTQDQRNAVIALKIERFKVRMKSCEVKYKFYKKIFDFISSNYESLSNSCNCCENIKDIMEEVKENK